jgi:hypothetical protein
MSVGAAIGFERHGVNSRPSGNYFETPGCLAQRDKQLSERYRLNPWDLNQMRLKKFSVGSVAGWAWAFIAGGGDLWLQFGVAAFFFIAGHAALTIWPHRWQPP